jgi:hypothetical protein
VLHFIIEPAEYKSYHLLTKWKEYALLFLEDRLLFVFIGWGGSPMGTPLGPIAGTGVDFGAGIVENEKIVSLSSTEAGREKLPIWKSILLGPNYRANDSHDEQITRDFIMRLSTLIPAALISFSEFNHFILFDNITVVSLTEYQPFSGRIYFHNNGGAHVSGTFCINLLNDEPNKYIVISKGVKEFEIYRQILKSRVQ